MPESVLSLLKQPRNYPAIVVAKRENVVQSREAVLLALFLHFLQLLRFKLVVLDGAPVVGGGVHREAWRKCAVDADNQRVVAGAAVPVLKLAVHKALHLRQ